MFFSINFLPLHFVCVCVYNNIYFEIQSTIYFEDVKSLDQTIAQKKADLSTPVICDAYDAFELWCWRRLLRVPWTARRCNQSILKEISPGCSLEGMMLKLKLPILWPSHVKSWPIGKDSDVGRDWGQEEKGMTEDETAGWHHRLDGHEFQWTLGVGDGQGGLVHCDSWGCKETDTTEQLSWTELEMFKK